MDINNQNNIAPVSKPAAGDFVLKTDSKTANAGTVLAPPQVSLPSPQTSEPDDGQQQVEQAVSQINDYVQNIQRSLQFSVDEQSGRNIVTVIDKSTEEVIRQIPIEEVLVMARTIAEQLDEGVSLFSSQA
jgi:flagellar protein FlaG